MKLKKVKPEVIKVPELRVRARFDDETLALFRQSVKEIGQVAPIICCLVDGEYVLVDGAHRLEEAKLNNADTIDVALIEGDMTDVLAKNIMLDHLRGKTPPTEMAKVIGELWKTYNLDSDAIAKKTGLSRDYIERLQKISELTPMCREAFDTEQISVSQAFELTRIPEPERQEIVLGQLILYRWKVKELHEYISTVLDLMKPQEPAPPPAPPAPPAKPHCHFCNQEKELSQIANPNICVECAGQLLSFLAQLRQAEKEEAKQRAG